MNFWKVVTVIITLLVLTNLPFAAEPQHEDHSPPAKQEQVDQHAGSHEDTGNHSESHAPHLNGSTVNILWIIPFLGILLSIAVLPLTAPSFWHHHYGKVSLFWGSTFIILFGFHYGLDMAEFYLLEVYLSEFIPFIVLLLSLFTVAGGVRLTGSLRGSPAVNTLILLIGTVLASWMGTTGAAMLLIRPIIRANAWRKKQVHIIVFFIFLVANIGGSLTPLGDPPLFLGFLKGVSFFWTTTHMFLPMLTVSVILLILFYIIDTVLYKKEKPVPDDGTKTPLRLEGKANLLLLPLVVGAVLISGIWHPDPTNPNDWAISAWGTCMMTKGVLAQVILLLLIAVISWKITPQSVRRGNGFTWEPILEVAKLFATIFITMVPAIAILKAGSEGALKFVIDMVKNPETGEFVNRSFFWATGILSSFLDNAPTYVVFFNTAGGDAQQLMTTFSGTLLAISAGAVFMGANTYIGNAPNFMVKSIAEENHIKMPSFFGYMAWSVSILIPIFFVVSFIFF
ncbi:MAG: sodium:proton antiporter [Candidatus Marinimicrobia bacterium]|nr:sodium:proton antiporter [Candidatus Neomarinimicrobiota bacterium]